MLNMSLYESFQQEVVVLFDMFSRDGIFISLEAYNVGVKHPSTINRRIEAFDKSVTPSQLRMVCPNRGLFI